MCSGKHLVPLMALPELAGHTALHEVTAKIKAANAFLEGEKLELEDQLNRLSGLPLRKPSSS